MSLANLPPPSPSPRACSLISPTSIEIELFCLTLYPSLPPWSPHLAPSFSKKKSTFFLMNFLDPLGHFALRNGRVWPPGNFCISGEFGLGSSVRLLGTKPPSAPPAKIFKNDHVPLQLFFPQSGDLLLVACEETFPAPCLLAPPGPHPLRFGLRVLASVITT